jgi:hypothetical protein
VSVQAAPPYQPANTAFAAVFNPNSIRGGVCAGRMVTATCHAEWLRQHALLGPASFRLRLIAFEYPARNGLLGGRDKLGEKAFNLLARRSPCTSLAEKAATFCAS